MIIRRGDGSGLPKMTTANANFLILVEGLIRALEPRRLVPAKGLVGLHEVAVHVVQETLTENLKFPRSNRVNF